VSIDGRQRAGNLTLRGTRQFVLCALAGRSGAAVDFTDANLQQT
jgi:hypothetical protein